MLGVSVYLGKKSEGKQDKYLKKMAENGFRFIFTSLHIPEDDSTAYKDLLITLGKQARKYGMELMADISPVTLQHLGFTYETIGEITDWGVTGLRMDYGIDPGVIASLSYRMKIALNASTLDDDFYNQLMDVKLNVRQVEAWHNYYPRPETGLEKVKFKKQNQKLHKLGFTVMAFIPGNGELRGPLYAGLPTLEDHRYLSPFTSAIELMEEHGVDKIAVGDLSITNHTITQFSSWMNGTIPLRCQLLTDNKEMNEIVSLLHTNRKDPARDVIRSEISRTYTNEKKIKIKSENTMLRNKGSVTIDNVEYGRYQGELQITTRDLKEDKRVNVVGKIMDEDIPLLSFIGEGRSFILEITNINKGFLD